MVLNRHVFYLGCQEVGIVGLIDASECPPTYGASLSDVKGFMIGGWKVLENKAGDMEGEKNFFGRT